MAVGTGPRQAASGNASREADHAVAGGDQVRVVGDHQSGAALCLLPHIHHQGDGGDDVNMLRGLVEDEKFSTLSQNPCQGETTAFAP